MTVILLSCVSSVLALLFVFIVVRARNRRRELINGYENDLAGRTAEEGRLKLEVTRLKDEKNKVESLDAIVSVVTEDVWKSLAMFIHAIPLAGEMTGLVIKKTEDSVMTVSDSIFDIGNESKSVGQSINGLLNKVSIGDRSLNNTATRVNAGIEELDHLLFGLKELYRQFRKDMDVIKKSVQGIEQYSDAITDLADQTNILAINASIEAARVGTQGKGFSVIANEVQSLSKKSKDLAEQIKGVLNQTRRNVDTSTERQSSQCLRMEGAIEKLVKEMEMVGTYLIEGVAAVGSSIEESKRLSEKVTAGLGEIIKSLQYQDIIRQVLEHIIQMFEDIKTASEERIREKDFLVRLNDKGLTEEVKKSASRHFTVREEWIAAGLSIEEDYHGNDGALAGKQLKGDITLF